MSRISTPNNDPVVTWKNAGIHLSESLMSQMGVVIDDMVEVFFDVPNKLIGFKLGKDGFRLKRFSLGNNSGILDVHGMTRKAFKKTPFDRIAKHGMQFLAECKDGMWVVDLNKPL